MTMMTITTRKNLKKRKPKKIRQPIPMRLKKLPRKYPKESIGLASRSRKSPIGIGTRLKVQLPLPLRQLLMVRSVANPPLKVSRRKNQLLKACSST